MNIGVLALQGSVKEHLDILKKCGVNAVAVRYPEQLDDINGLIIPGGESTTIGRLMARHRFAEKIKIRARAKKIAVYGTCAGLVIVSSKVDCKDVSQFTLGLIDIQVERNAFGRQRESFEAQLDIPELGEKPYPAVFIRAPIIKDTGSNVSVLARHKDSIVAARQDNILVSSFHPELTDDTRFHEYFIGKVIENK